MSQSGRIEKCISCGDVLERVYTVPLITGTRDSFGIGRKFKDERTGKEITTWKEWEKAGYSDPLKDGIKDKRGDKHAQLKEAVKRREFKNKKRFSVAV